MGSSTPLPVDEAASGWAWKHQEPIAIPDIERAALSRLRARVAQSRGPVLHRPSHEHAFQPFWSIGPGQERSRGLSIDEDVEFLSRVALMGALALEKERAHRAFEEQQSLVAISRELSSSLELEKLLPVILSSVRGIARYERAILCLLDEDGKNVREYGEALEWEPFVNHGSTTSARAIALGAGHRDPRRCLPHRGRLARQERTPGQGHV